MAETTSGLVIVRQAAMALNGFPPEDQARIRSTLGHLLSPTAIEKLGSRVHHLESDEPLYIVRVPPDILVIFTRQGDTVLILDVLCRGAVKSFASGSNDRHPGSKNLEKPVPSETARSRRRAKVTRASRGEPD